VSSDKITKTIKTFISQQIVFFHKSYTSLRSFIRGWCQNDLWQSLVFYDPGLTLHSEYLFGDPKEMTVCYSDWMRCHRSDCFCRV